VDGCFVIDKPAGLTSHDVVARVRKIVGERRVGHTGTLDPFATGVLVVLVGRATRLAQFLSGAEKEYEAVIRLGYATDTGDVTGSRLEAEGNLTAETQRTQSLRREEIDNALASLRGEIEQTPPMYSAKKIAGKKLYELARRGEEVERKAIWIKVSEFEAVTRDGALLKPNDDGTSDLAVRVVCSAGTYIRALAEVFGKHLGPGAHLAELRRTRAGQFKIEDAITLDRLSEQAQSGAIESKKISPSNAVSHLPAVELSTEDLSRTLHGVDMQIGNPGSCDWSGGQPVRMLDIKGDLVAVGIYDEGNKSIHPAVVIAGTL
jgi:tRNA pseudouridine55 synthase